MHPLIDLWHQTLQARSFDLVYMRMCVRVFVREYSDSETSLSVSVSKGDN